MTVSPAPARPLWVVLLCVGVIVAIAMGLRQVMGLYLRPVSMDLGLGREPFSNAMALSNLVNGLGAIAAGAVADRYGAGRVVVTGTVCTVLGLLMMFAAVTPFDLLLSGLLLGIGVTGTGLNSLVGAVGRLAPADRRTAAIASLGMATGLGNFLMYPWAHAWMEYLGWQGSLVILAATAMVMLPLAIPVAGKPGGGGPGNVRSQTLREAFAEAFAHQGFWLLTVGFFVCGFHVSFYATHLPAFVADQNLPAWVAVWALMVLGIVNIGGTWLAGQSARVIEKRVSLTVIYLGRFVLFLALLWMPITPFTVIALTAGLGLFWLSTIPLTSSMVATFFGTSWMSMLFGFVFFSHQLGSFAGLWAAGVLFDLTQSYDAMWWISAFLGLFAAAMHWPIKERPVPRVLAEQRA
jgi:MFS family permease